MAVHFKDLGVEIQPTIARDRNGFIPEQGDKPEDFNFHEGWLPGSEDEWQEYLDLCEVYIEERVKAIKEFRQRS